MKFPTGLLFSSCLVSIAAARPHANIKRDATALRDSYDFVIAGGGIVGLIVADRLTEAFPNKTVLVIEVGENEYRPAMFDPPARTYSRGRASLANTTEAAPSPSQFSVPFLPLPGVDYRVGTVTVGKAVGGGGAINGQFLDRGSRFDYDAWAELGGAGYEGWGWDGLYPSFKKSFTFTPPTPESVAKYNYTWDSSAFDNTTPLYASYPPFQWGDFSVPRKAFKEIGVRESRDCHGGDKLGICFVPSAVDPVEFKRSHAAISHYDMVRRSNYDLIQRHQVVRVVYAGNSTSCKKPPVVEVKSLADGTLFNVTAKAEVIISAGAIHTPTILQRSGIGAKSLLDQYNIPTIANLPGVGANYQDHWGPDFWWNYTNPAAVAASHWPIATEIGTNDTFFAEAMAGYDKTPAEGPYTMVQTQYAVYLPLANMTANPSVITARLLAQAADPALAAALLQPDHAAEPTLVKGYQRQLAQLAKMLSNPSLPSTEIPYGGSGTSLKLFILHPSSRGSVVLNMTDPLGIPILNTRLAANPVDMELHLTHMRWLRATFLQTQYMQSLGAYAVLPPPELDSADEEGLRAWIKANSALSVAHPCCTAAMGPREFGGVVDARLLVHGLHGLRVADMSVNPMEVSAHLSTTAYAVGEKAASIIISDYSS